jgi:predicted transcriptional regulator
MVEREEQTDEDKMIKHLEDHRDLITWVVKKLGAEGIPCQRTTGNDPGGDIFYYNPEDEPRVKEIVRKIKSDCDQA